MYEDRFSVWVSWLNRDALNNINCPGVYAIRVSIRNIENRKFSWHKEIAYIGMTNGISGLKGRLKAFDNTINGKRGHGGADRFRFKYQNYSGLVKKLYVSVAPFNADVKTNSPKDLIIMGNVAKFEYQGFAQYTGKFNELPEFNNKNLSKKYSLTHG